MQDRPGIMAAPAALFLLLLCGPLPLTTPSASGGGGLPEGVVRGSDYPRVPPGHPRVYMRPGDLPRLRAKAADRGARQLWQRVTNRADEDPVVQAFMHHIEQNSSYCDSAVAAQRARVASTLAKRPPNGGRLPDHDLSTVGRTFFSMLHTTSVVLDWCYDTLKPDARASLISGIKALANMDAPGYPIDFGNATSPPHWDTVVGHPCEGWVMTGQLPGGIAMYDDDPSMYEGAARYFFEGLLPVRQLAYKALKHYEGTHYTYARYEHEIASAMIWSAIGQPDVFPPTQPAVMSDYIYSLIPNGVSALLLLFREPSQSFPTERLRRRWWRTGTAR